jgi:hypothetical protein
MMFDRSGAMLQNERGVARRICAATLVAVAVVLITLFSGADARACPSDVTSKVPATISQKFHHQAKVIATGQAEVVTSSIRSSAVRLVDSTHCCRMNSGDFGCPGQCCVACSAAIDASALNLPSLDRSTDRVSLLADWAFSLRPSPLFRPPRSLA